MESFAGGKDRIATEKESFAAGNALGSARWAFARENRTFPTVP